MKTFLAVSAVALMAALTLTAGPANAAPASKTIQGKMVSFAGGKLKVKNNKGTVKYIVGKKTDCGYSTGMMGNSMPCSKLKKSKYAKKRVYVTWHAKNGRRIADLVSVQL
jgi:hypothetical protein